MPPRVKFQKKEIVNAAINVVRKEGIDAVTAREVAKELKVSVGPIFTWFETMDQLKVEVYVLAKEKYRNYIKQGLKEKIPFLGLWRQYIRFAKEEPELYKLLFLTKLGEVSGGAMETLKYSQDMARPSLMQIYNMDERTADKYFRDMWMVAFSFATLIVTDDCPYSDEEIFSIGTEVSLSLCKAFKEVPGLSEGTFDRDAVFMELVKK